MTYKKETTTENKAHSVAMRLAHCKPTIVYETYWRFAAERQAIFFRRIEGGDFPWTENPILKRYKFTNTYRASDRVSQYLIKNVIYKGDPSVREVFFRIILFKLFNRIDTWKLLEDKIGTITSEDYSFKSFDKILTMALESGRIFSGAYIMPSGVRSFGHGKKHRNFLKLVERMMKDNVHLRIANMPNMQQVFELLRSYPMIGDFLAYQLATDINYSNITNFSEMDFVVPGPGARDGIRKCFFSLGGLSEVEIIKLMADKQEEEFKHFGLEFRSLWGRHLQLIDCQNLFCEVDKYARLAHPEIRGRSKRVRLKRLYKMNVEAIRYWYPPKWGINEKLTADMA